MNSTQYTAATDRKFNFYFKQFLFAQIAQNGQFGISRIRFSSSMEVQEADVTNAASAVDVETQFFVQSFVRFLNEQIASNTFPADIVESLEVASQCLETAYNLPIEATLPSTTPAVQSATGDDTTSGDQSSIDASPNAMTHIDLRELFRSSCAGHPERKREADLVKNEGNRLMREEKFNEALFHYNR